MDLSQHIHDTSLEPLEVEDIDNSLAIKNYCLFTMIDDILSIAIQEKYMTISLGYIAKYHFDYPICFLDEESFDKLYNRCLEAKTDKDLDGIQEQSEEYEDEEEISLTEFLKTSSDILESEESAPIIKFVNSLFYQGVKKKASDIHIEMHEKEGLVRYRIDGILVTHAKLAIKIMNLIISRIKVISNLDISEKRIPQDGRTQIKIAGNTLDIRVSILPTYYGERVVMRILMQSSSIPSMDKLGFDDGIINDLNKIIQNSYGIILVTGPTGSGKSTTLHSLLHKIVSPEKNIITVEDPVEYKSNNISQIQVNEKVGLSFSAGLRSILRQDPDIVMLGEIRDGTTAKIAVQASLTGHLVLSTLHTNNSTASVSRLLDMGVENFLLSSSLLGVLAQRLVRVLCEDCKIEDTDNMAMRESLSIDNSVKIYKQDSCKKCNYSGYVGRKAVGELFIVDDDIKIAMKKDVNDYTLRQTAIEKGLITLSTKLNNLLKDGKTSFDEIIRLGL